MLRNADQRQYTMRSQTRKTSSSYASELGGGSVQKQERGLIRVEGAQDALENLSSRIREFVVRSRHRPDLGDRSQDGKEAEEFRILIHHRRSDGCRTEQLQHSTGLRAADEIVITS